MFRGDLQHAGVYGAPGVPKLNGVKWKFHTGGGVISSPAVVNGVAYIGSTDGNLYAVDAGCGALKWKFATGGEKRYAGTHLHHLEPAAETMPDPWDFCHLPPYGTERSTSAAAMAMCIRSMPLKVT
jgi:eukaryotic-like serine/threonine-protein kinase